MAKNWANEIKSAWQKSVDGIFETGRLLIDAKAALPHGKFEKMVRSELPFRERTAQMLMAIAADTRLAKANHWFAFAAKLAHTLRVDTVERSAARPRYLRWHGPSRDGSCGPCPHRR